MTTKLGDRMTQVWSYVYSPTTPHSFNQKEVARALNIPVSSAAYPLEKLVKRKVLVRTEHEGIVTYIKPEHLPENQALPTPLKRRRRKHKDNGVDALITLPIGAQSFTCNFDEARSVYVALKKIFG